MTVRFNYILGRFDVGVYTYLFHGDTDEAFYYSGDSLDQIEKEMMVDWGHLIKPSVPNFPTLPGFPKL
jgi:hypothetical protein